MEGILECFTVLNGVNLYNETFDLKKYRYARRTRAPGGSNTLLTLKSQTNLLGDSYDKVYSTSLFGYDLQQKKKLEIVSPEEE